VPAAAGGPAGAALGAVSGAPATTTLYFLLEGGVGGDFQIAPDVSFTRARLRVGGERGAASAAWGTVKIEVLGGMNVTLDGSPLALTGLVGVQWTDPTKPPDLVIAGSMMGDWREPFGVPNITLRNVAMQIDASLVPPPATLALSALAVGGTVVVGDVTAEGAIRASGDLRKAMLVARFNELTIQQLASLCAAAVGSSLSSGAGSAMEQIRLENVDLTFTPETTYIGELAYPPGYTAAGTLRVFDLSAQALVRLDPNRGFHGEARLSPVNAGDVLVIRGAGQGPGPLLVLQAMVGEPALIQISGSAEIVDVMTALVDLYFSESGFWFTANGAIYGLFACELGVKGADLRDAGGMTASVRFQDEYLRQLADAARAQVLAQAQAATAQVQNAAREVEALAQNARALDARLSEARSLVDQRVRAGDQLRQAQGAATMRTEDAKRAAAELDALRRRLEGQAKDAQKEIEKARAEVKEAEKHLKQLEEQMKKAKDRVKELKQKL